MFRKMRRFKQQLEQKECIEVLKSQPRGVLSILGEDGYPYDEIDVMPRYVQYS